VKIAVIGTGYVGLVSAACLAELGHVVIGYDVSADKIKTLETGGCPIYEPGLEPLLQRGVDSGRLSFTTDMAAAVEGSDVIFVCVGTPQADDGRADLSQVETVARTIANHLGTYKLIIEKSTVPVRTAQWIRRTIELYRSDASFSVGSNPEFLREGVAVDDFMNPDRIVVGIDDDRARELMQQVYAPLDCVKLFVDVETAEIIKHAANSFLALKISYINMISDLCEVVGADVQHVAEGMGLDRRIGKQFLNAGLGYGGYCFPKDVRAFQRIADDHNVDFSLLNEADEINQRRVPYLIDRLKSLLWVLRGKKIALWGLAFKPGTDDVREAPSLRVAKALVAEGATIVGWDPQAVETFARAAGDLPMTYAATPEEAVAGANAVVLMTEWPELSRVDLKAAAAAMETPVLFDARNYLDHTEVAKAGFIYRAVGRPGIEIGSTENH